MPKGARIQDLIAGKEYQFGVSAVREEDIGRSQLRGPRGSRSALLYTSIIVAIVVALMGALGWRIHRKGEGR
jgi:hypothetical protein